MANVMDVDVWVRGTNHARTERLSGVPDNASTWIDADVKRLLTEMLLALERAQNPGGDPPPVNLRGFSWIVSPDQSGTSPGVLIHLEMKMGTASAGPFAIEERSLTAMIQRVMEAPASVATVH